MERTLKRRDLLKLAGAGIATSVLAACQPQVVKETVVVEKEKVVAQTVEKVVKETVVVETQKEVIKEVTKIVEKALEPTKSSKGPVAITMMHLAAECTDDEVALFNTKYPNIKLSRMDLDDVKWYAMLAAGNPPDVKRQEGTALPYLLVRRIPLNLQGYFDVSEIIKQDDMAATNNYWRAASPMQQGTGDRYGLIKDWTPGLVIWANTTLFEKAGLPAPSDKTPMTYDELYDIARKLTKKEGQRTLQWGFSHNPGWKQHYWECWLKGLDKSLWSADFTKFNLLSQEETIACMKWDFDMAKEGLTTSPIDPSPRGWDGPDFLAGQLAITQFGLWFAATVQGTMAAAGMAPGNKAMMLPAPIWKGGKEVDVDFAAMGAVIARETKNPDEAWKVNEWYHAEEPAVTRAKLGWGIPAFKSMNNLMPTSPEIFTQAQAVCFGQEKKGATDVILPFSPFVKGDAVWSAFSTYFERALKGELSFEEMMGHVQTDVDLQIKEGMAKMGM